MKSILTEQSIAGTIQRNIWLTIKTEDGSAEFLNQELQERETRQVSGYAPIITDVCAWRLLKEYHSINHYILQYESIKKNHCALIAILAISFLQINAQVRYASTDERRDAGMGVERVARFFTPAYESRTGKELMKVRWIQIDLGATKKIDGIKLLPKVAPWGYVQSEGFPSRFRIEVSDDPDFKSSVMYIDQTREEFKDPFDEVCTFSGKEVNGRYVRLTAIHLRQQRLSFTKIMVLSGGTDIAEGCRASDSESGDTGVNLLTRPPRPQGEYVVTDNPGNIIPPGKWKPVAYKANTPKTGVELGEGLFRKTMENNISYLISSFTLMNLSGISM